jgi:hypothetical protein
VSDTYEHTKNLGELLVTLSSDCIKLQDENKKLRCSIREVAAMLRKPTTASDGKLLEQLNDDGDYLNALKAENITLRAEVERLKTELADTKRVYGPKGSTNEQKWEMLEKHCEVLEGAIRGWIEDIHRDRTPEGLDTLRYSMRKAVGQ